ncbi:MAG: hypothetical protein HYS12_13585 [Planctomycetes bacterium]|nr:hypothetical protein [Planctomycetota bacterium]
MERLTDWHRLFGLILTDFFAGSPFVVELEKDLSLKKQLLDVVILRKEAGALDRLLPDGLDDLAAHNLITFKSHQEALDDWALKELTGHYVNYRKQVSPSLGQLLPEEEFRLFAVCARFPHNLAGQVPWQELRPGVHECRRGTDIIRVVVSRQLPQNDPNALLHLFSAVPELVAYGRSHFKQRSADTSTLLSQLFEGYRREGLDMPYTMEDFRRDFTKEHLKDLTPEERLEGLSPEEILRGLSLEEVLKGLSSEELVAGLSSEQRADLLKRLKSDEPPTAAEGKRPSPGSGNTRD